jgi:EAL domain-containing protein (putative c-di-GMP-specific phosphodiesterase class I)
MLRFLGQPKFHLQDATGTPIGYELFVREYRNGRWVLPCDFNALTAAQMTELLADSIAALPKDLEMISFNLEQSQFIRSEFTDMVATLQTTTNIHIYTELTERADPNVADTDIVAAARRFHALGLLVCIDDVGTDAHSPALVEKLNPYVDEYKFALQNFRPFKQIAEINDLVTFWHNMSVRHGKVLAIEGIESQTDLDDIRRDYPGLCQSVLEINS